MTLTHIAALAVDAPTRRDGRPRALQNRAPYRAIAVDLAPAETIADHKGAGLYFVQGARGTHDAGQEADAGGSAKVRVDAAAPEPRRSDAGRAANSPPQWKLSPKASGKCSLGRPRRSSYMSFGE